MKQFHPAMHSYTHTFAGKHGICCKIPLICHFQPTLTDFQVTPVISKLYPLYVNQQDNFGDTKISQIHKNHVQYSTENQSLWSIKHTVVLLHTVAFTGS